MDTGLQRSDSAFPTAASISVCISVHDVLLTEEGCYQNLGADLNYEWADYVCSSELEGRLVMEESLGELASFLSSQVSHSQPGMNSSWWVGGGVSDGCSVVAGGGLRQEDCEGLSGTLCYLGLQCDPYSQQLVGPERCQCGCANQTAQHSPGDCELCWEGEFCYEDQWLQSQYCVWQCDHLPVTNFQPCFCNGEVCDDYGYNYCNLSSGCEYFQSCPVSPWDLQLSQESVCTCWEGGLCNITEFCSYDETTTTTTSTTTDINMMMNMNMTSTMSQTTSYSCLPRPEDCPELPHLTPPGGCSCNQSELCGPDLMCDPSLLPANSSCIERPPPCQPFPAVTGPEGCFCNITDLTVSPEICEEGEGCDETCFLPAYCDHPTALTNWTDYNARLVSHNNQTSFIQWSQLELECLEHTFTEHSVQARLFQKELSGVCSSNGTWDMPACVFPACPWPQLDAKTVKVTELFIVHNATTQGAKLKVSCKDETTQFNFGAFTRLFAFCNRSVWEVSDPAACIDQTAASTHCESLQELSCPFQGCPSLPAAQERVSHSGLTDRFITGATVTASCSHEVDQYSVLETYSDPSLVLSLTSPSYRPRYPAPSRWCPHTDCLPASGIPWKAANISVTGPDCVEEAGYGWAAWCVGNLSLIIREDTTAGSLWTLSQDSCESVLVSPSPSLTLNIQTVTPVAGPSTTRRTNTTTIFQPLKCWRRRCRPLNSSLQSG